MAWEPATVVAIEDETASAKTFRLRLSRPSVHLAGQHYVLRLSAPDGYSAQRSYSVASAPDGSAEIELTIERLPGGEVSMFMHDEVRVGDELELRGPIGGWFVWRAGAPALLIGGGSGVVPLMAMLRLARRQGVPDLVRLLVSVRRPQDLYYAGNCPGPRPRSSTPGPVLHTSPGRPVASPRTTSGRSGYPAPPCTSAGLRPSPTPPPTPSPTSALPSRRSEWNGSVLPASTAARRGTNDICTSPRPRVN